MMKILFDAMKYKQRKTNDSVCLLLRACPSAYIVFIVITGFPLLLSIIAMYKKYDPSLWALILVLIFIMLLSIIWLRVYKVILSDDSITYYSLFGGCKTIKILDIENIRVIFGGYKYPHIFRPMFSLIIWPISLSKKPIFINVKVFDKQGISELVRIIELKINKDSYM